MKRNVHREIRTEVKMERRKVVWPRHGMFSRLIIDIGSTCAGALYSGPNTKETTPNPVQTMSNMKRKITCTDAGVISSPKKILSITKDCNKVGNCTLANVLVNTPKLEKTESKTLVVKNKQNEMR